MGLNNIEETVRQCQQGNWEQFGLLFDAFHEKIYRFVFFRTQHKEIAEDITSQIFTKALERLGTYNSSKAKFSTWLYQIARNAVIDHYRTRKETAGIEEAWGVAAATSVEEELNTRQNLEQAMKYLNELTPQQRDIVILRVWDDMPYKDIAEVMGMSEAGVKMAFLRVMAKFQNNTAAVLLLLAVLYSSRQP